MFDANKVLCIISVFIGCSLAQNYFNAIKVTIIYESYTIIFSLKSAEKWEYFSLGLKNNIFIKKKENKRVYNANDNKIKLMKFHLNCRWKQF